MTTNNNDDPLSLPSSYKEWRMQSAAKDVKDLSAVKDALELTTLEQLPALQPGQVLVKVACCTLNDEERLHLAGDYINTKDVAMPRPIGFEGSGIVVASKAPWYSPAPKVGTRVAFYVMGALTEYLVISDPVNSLIPIPPNVSYERGASAVTNPFTVILMADKVKREGHKVVINTVPAGALGRVFTKYCASIGVDVIGTVRRDEQQEICLQDGAKHVLNMKDDKFEEQLAKVIQDTGCRFAYDGLGGDMPNILLKVLPKDSIVSVYSHIASEHATINVLDLFGKTLETFNSAAEAKTMPIWQMLKLVSKLQAWMTQPEMATTIRKSYPLQELPEAVVDSATGSKTDGKVQVIVNQSLVSTKE